MTDYYSDLAGMKTENRPTDCKTVSKRLCWTCDCCTSKLDDYDLRQTNL